MGGASFGAVAGGATPTFASPNDFNPTPAEAAVAVQGRAGMYGQANVNGSAAGYVDNAISSVLDVLGGGGEVAVGIAAAAATDGLSLDVAAPLILDGLLKVSRGVGGIITLESPAGVPLPAAPVYVQPGVPVTLPATPPDGYGGGDSVLTGGIEGYDYSWADTMGRLALVLRAAESLGGFAMGNGIGVTPGYGNTDSIAVAGDTIFHFAEVPSAGEGLLAYLNRAQSQFGEWLDDGHGNAYVEYQEGGNEPYTKVVVSQAWLDSYQAALYGAAAVPGLVDFAADYELYRYYGTGPGYPRLLLQDLNVIFALLPVKW